MSGLGNIRSIPGRLYRGEVSVDFVGKRKLWYSISGAILVISVAAVLIFGLNFSIDFKGGTQFQFPVTHGATATGVEQTVKNAGGGAEATASEVKPLDNAPPFWQVQTGTLTTGQTSAVQTAIVHAYHPPKGYTGISVSTVSASWGSQISQKAAVALVAFMIVIVLYLTIAFEWRMAVAAFVALLHDIVITVGVYALAHFEVSPATVIGLLTILGYSLYDTVVVFDKVRENTAPILGTRKSSYSQAANLALNQTLVRSINTSLIALLPVAAILIVGTTLLGNGELKDLSLVLFVGMLSGTYSSICIATPVLTDIKERDPKYQQLAKQVERQAAGGRTAQRKARQAEAAAAAAGVAGASAGAAAGSPSRRGPTGNGSQAGATAASLDDTGLDAAEQTPAPDNTDASDQVPAGQTAVPGGQPARSSAARPAGQRQQPNRRPGSTNRRPSGKKKRR
jgi:preprotein translocase subunit SecF